LFHLRVSSMLSSGTAPSFFLAFFFLSRGIFCRPISGLKSCRSFLVYAICDVVSRFAAFTLFASAPAVHCSMLFPFHRFRLLPYVASGIDLFASLPGRLVFSPYSSFFPSHFEYDALITFRFRCVWRFFCGPFDLLPALLYLSRLMIPPLLEVQPIGCLRARFPRDFIVSSFPFRLFFLRVNFLTHFSNPPFQGSLPTSLLSLPLCFYIVISSGSHTIPAIGGFFVC